MFNYYVTVFNRTTKVNRTDLLNMMKLAKIHNFTLQFEVRNMATRFYKVKSFVFTYERKAEHMEYVDGHKNAKRIMFKLVKQTACDIAVVYGADCYCNRCNGAGLRYVNPLFV